MWSTIIKYAIILFSYFSSSRFEDLLVLELNSIIFLIPWSDLHIRNTFLNCCFFGFLRVGSRIPPATFFFIKGDRLLLLRAKKRKCCSTKAFAPMNWWNWKIQPVIFRSRQKFKQLLKKSFSQHTVQLDQASRCNAL